MRRFNPKPLLWISGIPVLIALVYFPWGLLNHQIELVLHDTEAMQGFVGNLPEVLTGVLGFTVSVVAIVVQLAADRFTPKVTDLFLRQPVNLAVFIYLIFAVLVSLWTTLLFASEEKPVLLVLLNLATSSLAFGILIPYFAYVFRFLQPASIIEKIDGQVRQCIHRFNCLPAPRRTHALTSIHGQALYGIAELKTIAANAIQQRESPIVLLALDSLKNLAIFYVNTKYKIDPKWFSLTLPIYRDPDFVSMDEEKLKEIEAQNIWLELKILREYQAILSDSLNNYREACYIIGINTRELVERGFRLHSQDLVHLGVKFFNTYLRAIINKSDVRTGYNLLKQYRLVAQSALYHQDFDTCTEIAQNLRYYSLICYKAGLLFLCETIAFDLGELTELACQQQLIPLTEQLLDIMLKIDQDPESEQQENSLRGIRKSQSKLAAYFLRKNHRYLAQRIFEDMSHEPKGRLRVIEDELLNTRADFWEFTDRGDNFYYVKPELRPFVVEFFTWFVGHPQPIAVENRPL
ncbi:MAG: hypothetical protein OHK0012_09120 [Synechococcales cyanobacterium]